MHWDYRVVVVSDNMSDNYGVKLYKILISDTGEELTTVETTAEDARDNAEAGFIEEYYLEIQASLRDRLEWLMKYESNADPRTLPSGLAGQSYGSLLNQALSKAKILRSEA